MFAQLESYHILHWILFRHEHSLVKYNMYTINKLSVALYVSFFVCLLIVQHQYCLGY